MKLKHLISVVAIFIIIGFQGVYAAQLKSNSGLKLEGDCSIIITYAVNIAINPKVGAYLVGPNGMTLYYLGSETASNIKCNNNVCLEKWPIFYQKELALPRSLNPKDFNVFERTDGQNQISYKNHPLYYFVGDKKTGDTFGNDLKTPVGVWHIINIK